SNYVSNNLLVGMPEMRVPVDVINGGGDVKPFAHPGAIVEEGGGKCKGCAVFRPKPRLFRPHGREATENRRRGSSKSGGCDFRPVQIRGGLERDVRRGGKRFEPGRV